MTDLFYTDIYVFAGIVPNPPDFEPDGKDKAPLQPSGQCKVSPTPLGGSAWWICYPLAGCMAPGRWRWCKCWGTVWGCVGELCQSVKYTSLVVFSVLYHFYVRYKVVFLAGRGESHSWVVLGKVQLCYLSGGRSFTAG